MWLQILTNYATLLVAVSAVALSVWQGYEMRKYDRLSVLSNLDVNTKQLTVSTASSDDYGIISEYGGRDAERHHGHRLCAL